MALNVVVGEAAVDVVEVVVLADTIWLMLDTPVGLSSTMVVIRLAGVKEAQSSVEVGVEDEPVPLLERIGVLCVEMLEVAPADEADTGSGVSLSASEDSLVNES